MTKALSTPPPTVTATAGGIQMTIDLHQMLTAIDPGGRWVGYDPDADEDRYEPSSLALQIADLTADRLTKAMRREVTSMIENAVSAAITEQVTGLVRDHILGTEVQQTDDLGAPVGKPLPLTRMVLTAAENLTKTTGYGREQTPMQKLVNEAVGTAFKTELANAVKQAKTDALAVVQDTAATVIRETIERSARGI